MSVLNMILNIKVWKVSKKNIAQSNLFIFQNNTFIQKITLFVTIEKVFASRNAQYFQGH